MAVQAKIERNRAKNPGENRANDYSPLRGICGKFDVITTSVIVGANNHLPESAVRRIILASCKKLWSNNPGENRANIYSPLRGICGKFDVIIISVIVGANNHLPRIRSTANNLRFGRKIMVEKSGRKPGE